MVASISLYVEVSVRLKEDYDNGKSYYPLHGQELHAPPLKAELPSQQYLEWHNDNVYLG